MTRSNFFFILSLLIPLLFSQQCSVDSSSFSSPINPSPTISGYLISPQDEVITGVNYGKVIAIGGRVWMMKNLFSLNATVSNFSNPCPAGWGLPEVQDLNNLVAASGTDPTKILRNPDFFGMSTSQYFMSNTKAYSNSTNPVVAQSWVFYGIKFLSTGTAQVTQINSYFQSKLIKAFCVLQRSNETTQGTSGIVVKGVDNKDLVKGLKYVLSVNNTNVLNYYWKVGDVTGNSKYLDFIPMVEGMFTLNYKVMMFDGTVVGDCRVIWVRNYTGSEADTYFSLSSIKNVSYPFFKYRNTGLHFNSGSAPLAPKDDGGNYFVLLYK